MLGLDGKARVLKFFSVFVKYHLGVIIGSGNTQ